MRVPVAHSSISDDWLGQYVEPILEPAQAIIDPHHHLWDFPGSRYLLFDYLKDIQDGHNVTASVYLQCRSMYRIEGAEAFKSLGETEFANGMAAQSASGLYGGARVCAAIVASCDLRLDEHLFVEVLDAHLSAASGRLRGMRQPSNWHASGQVPANTVPPPPGLLRMPEFRRGIKHLIDRGLSLDVYCFHTQLSEVTDLARDNPGVSIILDHCGTPLGIGPYDGQRNAVFSAWRRDLQELGACCNVALKLGGLGAPLTGFGFEKLATPASSEVLAHHWRPYVETCIELFGVKRCMFESNFPVDKVCGSYRTVWNAFKRITSGATASEKQDLFCDTARRIYRLEGIL